LLPAVTASAAVAMEAAEENFAEQQQTERLPEGNRVPPKDWRDKNVPQASHDKAEHKDSSGDAECDFYCFRCVIHNLTPYFFQALYLFSKSL
jgi:hypothetical protein